MKYSQIDGKVREKALDLAHWHFGRTIQGHEAAQQSKLQAYYDFAAYADNIMGGGKTAAKKVFPKTPKSKTARKVVKKTAPRKKATARLRARQCRIENLLKNGATAQRKLTFEAVMERLDDKTFAKVMAALEKS